MDRIEFDKLEIMNQVSYINHELSKGESLRNISQVLTMSKTTIRDRFIKIDYIYNKELRQYDKGNTLVIQEHKGIKELPQVGGVVFKEPIFEGNTKELQKYKGDLMELINYKDDILEMLSNYKSNTNVIEVPQLDINSLPGELQKDSKTKSIKIYEPVYKIFNDLCDTYGNYTKQDMISLALVEFCKKYNKK